MSYAPSLSAGDQHDDHCRLTFAGHNWWIAAVRGDLIGLINETGRTVLDVSKVDWPRYHDAAEALMRARFGLDAGEKPTRRGEIDEHKQKAAHDMERTMGLRE